MKQTLIIIAALMVVFLGTAMLSMRVTTLDPVKNYALLIEVSEYETDSLKDLQFPKKEAEALAQELQALYGFKVEILNSPKGKSIVTKFDELYESYGNGELDPTGQLVIYLSGHGLFDEKSKSGFFLPSDYNPAILELTGLPYDLWRKKINSLPCKHIFVILDACYSGTFDEATAMRGNNNKFIPRRPGTLSDVDKILAEHDNRKTRVFVSSGLKEQTPDKSELSYRLLDGLREGIKDQGLITLDELYIGHMKHAKPTPLYKAFGDNDPGSHFLFLEGGVNNEGAEKYDEQLWNWVKRKPSEESYKFYLSQYPTGRFTQEANNQISSFIIDLNTKLPKVIYVNHKSPENRSGKSWDESIRDLQYALAIANPGDKIWVAAGTYFPSTSGDRNKSFEISSGIELYGGFSGTERSIEERNLSRYSTSLSGNIGDKNQDIDNSYNVVYTENIGEDVVVDGFTITGGNAKNFREGLNAGSSGGGWFNLANGSSSSPKIVNVTFLGNRAHNGGGMINLSSNGGDIKTSYINVRWRNNSSDFNGGALYNYGVKGNSSPIIQSSLFSENESNAGAAITNNGFDGIASPTINGTNFENNSSLMNGAAIYNIVNENGETAVVIEKCSFIGNESILADDVVGNVISRSIADRARKNGGPSLRPITVRK